MEQTFMKEKKIIPLVLSMSLPMMLSMLVNSLYNIVDSYFVAQINERLQFIINSKYQHIRFRINGKDSIQCRDHKRWQSKI